MFSRINKKMTNVGGGPLANIAGGVLPTDAANKSQVDASQATVQAEIDSIVAGTTTLTSVTTTGLVTAGSKVVTDSITEKTVGKGITMSQNLVLKRSLSPLNATGTITAAMVNSGGITSTSAAGVTATLDAIATIVAQTGATAGSSVDFVVDNTAGSSTVTVAVSAGIVVAKQTSNGDTAVDQLLTVAASATIGVGRFMLYFQSTSAAVLFRVN